MDRNINKEIPRHRKEKWLGELLSLPVEIVKGDIRAVSRAITLIENKKIQYEPELLHFLASLPKSETSLRIAVTGSPGVGKSTFIEAFGLALIEQGYTVAVMAIDPSSENTRGSILGDKTRMEKLSRSPKAYIRPSSNALEQGGIRTSTFQSIRICEAAKYDFILVETVGVGQSELEVSKMVDLMFLILSPTGGDELQGLKKGIVEHADMIIVNKCDGSNREAAERTRKEYANAIHYSRNSNNFVDRNEVRTVSSVEGSGIGDLTAMMINLLGDSMIRKKIDLKRNLQNKNWFIKQAMELLYYQLSNNQKIERMVLDYAEKGSFYESLLTLNQEIGKKLKEL